MMVTFDSGRHRAVICLPRRVAQAVAVREDRAVDEAEEEDPVVATAKEDA